MDSERLPRGAKVTYTIESGADILAEGQEAARHLWNYIRYCVVSHNRKLHYQRVGKVREQIKGEWYYVTQSMAGLLPRYPGRFSIDKEMRDYWAAQKLSDRCFSYTVKDFDIAMRSWFSNLKNNPLARPPRYCTEPRQLTFEIGRNAKHLGDWRFQLTVLGGRGKGRHAIIKMHIQPGIKVRDCTLIRISPTMEGTVVYYKETMEASGDAWAGIDLGIINLAAIAFSTGDTILYNGRGLLSEMQWYDKRAARCKPTGWKAGQRSRGSSPRYDEYKRKAGAVRALAVHNLTRHIIDACTQRGVETIVIGDLKGIREGKDYGKKMNQKLHAWPFAKIREQIEYKAASAGIKVIAINEAYTSKTCSRCGVIGQRVERGLFRCPDCGLVINADINGAINILNKVSPAPIRVGVGAVLPSPPSPEFTQGTGAGVDSACLQDVSATAKKVTSASQIEPVFVAEFDLRDWRIVQRDCNVTARNQLQSAEQL